MSTNKWNNYFFEWYKPMNNRWSEKDIKKYEKWYFGWLNYIQFKYGFKFKKKDIMEIGSGVGGICSLLDKMGAHVIGSDVSSVMIEYINLFAPHIKYVYCNIQKLLPFRKKFDYIMAFEVLEHLRFIDKSISNIYEALKPGAWFIGSSPYPFAKNFLDPTHVNVKYPEEWNKLFLDLGFQEVICQPLSFLPMFWRVNKLFNIPLPFYIGLPGFVSTTLILAKK